MPKTRDYCFYPYSTLFIDVNGDMGPCCAFSNFANLGDGPLHELWNNDRFVQLRTALREGSEYQAMCSGCGFVGRRDISTFPEGHVTGRKGATAHNYRAARQEYDEGAVTLSSLPLHLILTVTMNCNIDCNMCYQDRADKRQLDIDGLRSNLETALAARFVGNTCCL